MRKAVLIAALVCLPAAIVLAGKSVGKVADTEAIFSSDQSVRTAAADRLRLRGSVALDELFAKRTELIERRDAAANDPPSWTSLNDQLTRLDEAIDRVSGQRYGSVSRLYWHTDWEQAQTEAVRTGKPILSLRMLGLLTDEYSCANSRFFRTTLYANQEVSKLLREKFVLHWKSVRPVPRITIDFGDGRKLERTVTGNSAHYALAPDGRTLDALPGLYGPAAFLEWLNRVSHLSQVLRDADAVQQAGILRAYHLQRLEQIEQNWKSDLASAGLDAGLTAADLQDEDAWRKVAALHGDQAALDAASIEVIRTENPNAAQAGRLALTKARVEDPILRLVAELQTNIALDTVRNEHRLHGRIHRRLADDLEASRDVEALNEWVYAELFLTPSSDPWLGLAPTNTYTALRNNGVAANQSSK
jgi:hypothetical protein